MTHVLVEFFLLQRATNYILHPGVIDCVSNTVLEVIQGESELPMKIRA
jgi:hypothetical protein